MNNLLPAVQSAYRKQHSTETAVLKVLSDIYSAADAGQITLLGLLDLSSAFDTVDHRISFDRLQHFYGFEGAVLGWFRSYLTGWFQYIRYNGVQSESAPVLYGVPQGSVLGCVVYSVLVRCHRYSHKTRLFLLILTPTIFRCMIILRRLPA